MFSWVLPLTIEIEQHRYTTEQFLVALLVLIAIYTALAVAKYHIRWAGLPSDQARHAKHLLGQRAAKTPRKVRFSAYEVRNHAKDFRQKVEEAVKADPDETVEQDRPTLLQASVEVRKAWGSAFESVTSSVPALSRRVAYLGGLDLVLGVLAIASVERWRSAAEGETTYPGITDIGTWISDITMTVFVEGADILFAFPGAEMLYAFTFAYALLLGTWLYHNPIITSLLLFSGAGIITALDWHLVGDAKRQIEGRQQRVSWRTTAAIFIVWLIGSSVATFGRLLGFESVGAALGFLAAFLATVFFVTVGVYGAYVDLKRTATYSWPDDPNHLVVSYLVARRSIVLVAAVIAPIVAIYALVVLATGRLFEWIQILFVARLEIQALALAFVALLVFVALYLGRDSLDDLRVALGDVISEAGVKAVLMRRGMPIAVMAIIFLIATSGGVSIPVSVVFALVFGIVVRFIYSALRSAKYHVSMFADPEDTVPTRVIVDAYTLNDGDGREQYWADVNGKSHAHTDPDLLVDAIVKSAKDLVEDGEIDPKISTRHADHLTRLGITSVDDHDGSVDEPTTLDKLTEEVRRGVFGNLRKNNARMTEDELRKELDDCPPELVNDKLKEWELRPTSEGQIVREGDYIRLVR